MANIFAITTVADDIKADKEGKASAVFTVTNNSNKPVRGIAKAKALGNTQQDWLNVDGETERDFSASGTQQYTVNFRKPVAAGQPVEKFSFRLDVSSAINPDEQFTEGPAIHVEVTPPIQPPPKKPFPWWIILVAAGILLLVIGAVLFFAFCGRGGGKFSGTWVNANPAATPAPGLGYLITKLEIEQSGNDLKVHVWNRCTPTDCDWDVVTGTVEEGIGMVTIDHGVILHKMQIKEDGQDKIKTVMNTSLRYGNTSQPAVEFSFNKQQPPQ